MLDKRKSKSNLLVWHSNSNESFSLGDGEENAYQDKHFILRCGIKPNQLTLINIISLIHQLTSLNL